MSDATYVDLYADAAELKRLREEVASLCRQNDLLSHYVWGYGNASTECSGGYPQFSGYVCGYCGADRSVGGKCGMPAEDRP